jgi:hypothetical protein
MLKLLDGWKTWGSAVVWTLTLLFALIVGQDLTPIAQGIATALHWETPTGETLVFYGLIANSFFALWGVAAKVVKARAQRRAGATLREMGSPIGVVKAALADGSLSVDSTRPATLVMTQGGEPVTGTAAVTLIVQPERAAIES